MKKITAALAAAVGLAAVLTVGAPAQAATFAAKANLTGSRVCQDATGFTQQQVTLNNVKSSKRAQFKVARTGDAVAESLVYVWVKPGEKKVITVTVPEQETVSVRVRVPEMGTKNLVLSATVVHLGGSCHKEVYAPKVSLGGSMCSDTGDSVVQVMLDNRLTTDKAVTYELVVDGAGYESTLVAKVPAKALLSQYVNVRQGTAHLTVLGDGTVLFEQNVTARSC